jgi:hypothetical protein
VDTAVASDSAFAESRQPRYTRNPTLSVPLASPALLEDVAQDGTLPVKVCRPLGAAVALCAPQAIAPDVNAAAATSAAMRGLIRRIHASVEE